MDNNLLREKSMSLVGRSFTGVLGTVDQNGLPQIKAMIKTASDGLKEFWFCSNTSSKRVKQILENPNASLYFYDEKSFEGLMLTGKAEVSYDDNKRKEFWQDGMERYYPLGCTDPDYALVRFVPKRGNYYHGLINMDFEIY
ncbi:pyridoxamine 5'-phosphate oxidase family protein [Alkaliphilus peptidifermentans]|uniref:General stress protein 26 n=1 Tax=Alkaliphilus peptidifermentans DSM 18978 TaxID=1120976 RepID=A0A1G5L0I8_9FIRM|nr:pyridoxamine 5'-phosphate oxidase family protein [Alkaliphilus peptidifermentans]SCZ05858.1 General stress protein 26 [Alkaliphilus peptidifermentans DSM 18978]